MKQFLYIKLFFIFQITFNRKEINFIILSEMKIQSGEGEHIASQSDQLLLRSILLCDYYYYYTWCFLCY